MDWLGFCMHVSIQLTKMEKAFTEQVQEDVKLELAQVHAC
jgi:hypothetical protein